MEALSLTGENDRGATLLEGLNPEQVAVVTHHEGPLFVQAVAGAGKTAALVKRIAYLIQVRNAAPSEILAVTFSKKAADEMNKRLVALGVDGCRVGTWHSVCLQICRTTPLKNWEIDDKDKYRGLVKIVLGFREMDWKGADLSTVLGYIGRCKAALAEPGSDKARAIARAFFDSRPCRQTDHALLHEAYERTEQARRQRRLLTFDDFLVEAWRILDNGERGRWAARWSYLLQDECQDENEAQDVIAEMLARDHRNYMVVGDFAQSIYGFRGSEPQRFLDFEKKWAAKRVQMHRNYRSAGTIIEAANRSLATMEGAVKMTCERGGLGAVTSQVHGNFDAEAASVADEVQLRLADGQKPSSFAVLYRTNAQSRALEEAFLSRRLPHVVLGGVNFYRRKEVQDLLAYLRVAAGRDGFDAVKRCINAPFRFLGKAFVAKLEARDDDEVDWPMEARDLACHLGRRQATGVHEWANLIEVLRERMAEQAEREVDSGENLDRDGCPQALLELVLSDTHYLEWLTRDEGSETAENSRAMNVRELVRSSERFRTVDELLDYVDETLAASRRARGKKGDVTVLCSLHRSKGLEWPTVFLTGVNERILPHARAEDIGEERRLFYVGVTRARDWLIVSHVKEADCGGVSREMTPSRFLREAGLLGGEGQ